MRMLNLSKAAEYLGVAGPTLKRWSNAGLCPAYKTPLGHRRWTTEMLDDIKDAMLEQGCEHTSEKEIANPLAG
jgi:predicted site-specific integrase-resolvase